ncbi:hypothetical protein PR048_031299 [Dryococelus australis]|uniref:Uncharacterized protein n=1 Tax=Dryococelus australis TaxID=614101 RepID=A0ABQ9G5Z8_9NEOP|nr:hypothetical protein PR048_031299 [Dryococelus australis]
MKMNPETDVVPHFERLENRTVKRRLVSDLTEMRRRKRHPENSKCEENKSNGTRATECQPGPSLDISVIQRIPFFRKLNEIIPNASIICGGRNKAKEYAWKKI